MTGKGCLTLVQALAFAALLGYISLYSQEVQFPMLCLLIFSFTLGVLQPKAAWRWGLLIGLSIPLSYAIASAINARVVDASREPLTLVVLVIPALAAAYTGVFINRLSKIPDGPAA